MKIKNIPKRIYDIVWRLANQRNIPIRVLSNDPLLVQRIRGRFEHSDRQFVYGLQQYVTDCLYCHAVPGVIELILLKLNEFYKLDKKGNKLLNLGGGTGQVSDLFRAVGFNVFNLDIEVKKQNARNVQFDLNSKSDLPYRKEFFDVVICQEIIEHIENPWDLFRKVTRVLKPGGHLILTTPNIESRFSWRKFSRTGYFHWFSPENFSYHINALPVWEIEMLSAKNGFEIQALRGNGQYYFDRNWDLPKDKIIEEDEGLIYFLQKKSER